MQQQNIPIGTLVDMYKRGEMRDMVALSVLLAGFTQYLCDRLDADIVYRGG